MLVVYRSSKATFLLDLEDSNLDIPSAIRIIREYKEITLNEEDGYVKWVFNPDKTCERIRYTEGDWRDGGGWHHAIYDKDGKHI